MNAGYTPSDTLSEADKAAAQMEKLFKGSLLEFGAKVRADEKAKAAPALSLLATIKANVDNGNLDDRSFREFVRNSLSAG